MKKLQCILLVEDDETVNFYNKFLLEDLGITEKIVIRNNGSEAIDYLKTAGTSGAPFPDLIFLDINMPVMNGFEFIEEYEGLPETFRANALVIMLTTSLHPKDIERANSYNSISDYVYKPLLGDKVGELLEKYFN